LKSSATSSACACSISGEVMRAFWTVRNSPLRSPHTTQCMLISCAEQNDAKFCPRKALDISASGMSLSSAITWSRRRMFFSALLPSRASRWHAFLRDCSAVTLAIRSSKGAVVLGHGLFLGDTVRAGRDVCYGLPSSPSWSSHARTSDR
jgi:hypothetical protein